MKVEKTDRGFEFSKFTDANGENCSVQQSSAIGDYDDSFECPGTSYLWLGREGLNRMHLDREGVRDLIGMMQTWIDTGYLEQRDNQKQPSNENEDT